MIKINICPDVSKLSIAWSKNDKLVGLFIVY